VEETSWSWHSRSLSVSFRTVMATYCSIMAIIPNTILPNTVMLPFFPTLSCRTQSCCQPPANLSNRSYREIRNEKDLASYLFLPPSIVFRGAGLWGRCDGVGPPGRGGGDGRRCRRGGAAGEERRSGRWRPQRNSQLRGSESYPFVPGANRSIRKYVCVYSPASGPQVADGVQNGKFQLTQEL